MKKLYASLTAYAVVFFAVAQIQIPQPSPSGSVSSTVGLTEIKIDYYRPGVKGRKIFGIGDEYLEQYGEIWRTGANAGSMIHFSTDVEVAGQAVKAGKYQIVSLPNAEKWEVMFLSEPIGGNEASYSEDKVAIKTTVTPEKTENLVERMTFNISDISADNTSAHIVFAWENTSWKIPVKVEYANNVNNQIMNAYRAAATHYLNEEENLDQALMLMDLYLAGEGKSQEFWNLFIKAQILAKLGKNEMAIEVAKESMEKAKNWEGGDFGYVKRNQDLIDSIK